MRSLCDSPHEGACVVVADLVGDSATEVAREIGNEDRAIAVAMDVTSSEQVGAAFAAAALAFGGVDLVVNNAGLSISKPLLETTEHDWDLQHDVMAKGSFLVSREAARVMMQQRLGGDIVYISSKNGVFAGPRTSRTARQRRIKRTKCVCSPRSSASSAFESTVSTPMVSCGARASLPRAGALNAPPCTAWQRRTWGPSTRSGLC